jgi:diaminopimelate epimerase
LILLQESVKADFSMRIFNADGTEPAMCGNGLRCLVAFLRTLDVDNSSLSIETPYAILSCRSSEKGIGIRLGVPQIISWEIALPLQNGEMTCYVLDTGVPHAVTFVSDLDSLDVDCLGREIRSHPLFAPHGVNVDFVSRLSDSSFSLRTYERGVEGETLACGTGAAAAAYVSARIYCLEGPLSIMTRSQEMLEIHLEGEERSLFMMGPATQVFCGRVLLS